MLSLSMQLQQTEQLFKEVISQRDIAKKLDLPSSTIWQLRQNLKKGKVTYNRMFEILEQAGYQAVSDIIWKKQ